MNKTVCTCDGCEKLIFVNLSQSLMCTGVHVKGGYVIHPGFTCKIEIDPDHGFDFCSKACAERVLAAQMRRALSAIDKELRDAKKVMASKSENTE